MATSSGSGRRTVAIVTAVIAVVALGVAAVTWRGGDAEDDANRSAAVPTATDHDKAGPPPGPPSEQGTATPERDGTAAEAAPHETPAPQPTPTDGADKLEQENDEEGGAQLRIEIAPASAVTLDLSGLNEDVTATNVATRTVIRSGDTHPPGQPLEIELSRPGYAPQLVSIDAVPERDVYVIEPPSDWSERQAVIDLRGLEDGVTAWIDGEPREGLVLFAHEGHIVVELRRQGHVAQEVEVPLSLGATRVPTPENWDPATGNVGLSSLPEGTTAHVGDRQLTDGAALTVGSHTIDLRREGFESRSIHVDIAEGETAVIRLRYPLEPVKPQYGGPLDTLLDLVAWDAARSSERRKAAKAVEKRMPGFKLKGLKKYSAGDQTHEIAVFTHAKTGLEFSLIPVGRFTMGSPEDEPGRLHPRETQHVVRITRPFLMARTECTQRAWERGGGKNESTRRDDRFPVIDVSWNEADTWARDLGLRLPTEAEWEYACRAGTTTTFNVGDEIDIADANFDGTKEYRGEKSGTWRQNLLDCGSLPPNAFGLHDCHGNVHEWCRDVYLERLHGPIDDPVITEGPPWRVGKGGAWNAAPTSLRAASRNHLGVDARSEALGFRPACTVPADE